MEDKIYENQPLSLPIRFYNNDGVIDITGMTIECEYRDPDGGTGTLNGSIVSGSTGDAVIVLAQGLLTPSGSWCFQGFAVDGANRWPAEKTQMIVEEGC